MSQQIVQTHDVDSKTIWCRVENVALEDALEMQSEAGKIFQLKVIEWDAETGSMSVRLIPCNGCIAHYEA